MSSSNKPPFIGFSSFNSTANNNIGAGGADSNNIKPAPGYTGDNATVQNSFRWLSSKKDHQTKTRALVVLKDCYEGRKEELNKFEKVQLLCHFTYLFNKSLVYSNSRQIRALSLQILLCSSNVTPKAFDSLCKYFVGSVWICAWEVEASESRNVAQELLKVLQDRSSSDDNEYATLIRQHVIQKFNHLLAHSNKVQEFGSTVLKTESSSSADNNDKGEEMFAMVEECYERVILSVLFGLSKIYALLNDKDNDTVLIEQNLMWKHWSNTNKGSFRRASYKLLSAILSLNNSTYILQMDKSNIHKKKWGNRIILALSSEKDPSNVSSLFECVVLFLNFLQQTSSDEIEDIQEHATKEDFIIKLCDAFSKQLKSCCHFAPTSEWSLLVLPFLSLILSNKTIDDRFDLSCKVLSNLYKGSSKAVSSKEKEIILCSALEICLYLFITPTSTLHDEISVENCTTTILVDVFLETLIYFLEAKSSSERFVNLLVKVFVKIASPPQIDSLAFILSDEIWSRAESIVTCAVKSSKAILPQTQFTRILHHINKYTTTNEKKLSSPNDAILSRFKLICVPIVNNTLSDCKNEQIVPVVSQLELFYNIISLVGLENVFPGNSFQSFFVGDLLNWTRAYCEGGVLQDKALVQTSFKLARICHSKNNNMWGMFLDELLKHTSGCSLSCLGLGISTLIEADGTIYPTDLISTALDDFVLEIAQLSLKMPYSEDDSHSVEVIQFLRTCLGLSTVSSLLLVSPNVIERIAGLATRRAPFYGNLLQLGEVHHYTQSVMHHILNELILSKEDLFDKNTVKLLLLEDWIQGGSLWSEEIRKVIVASSKVTKDFISSASWILSEQIKTITSNILEDSNGLLDSFAEQWCQYCWRLLDLCDILEGSNSKALKPFELVGLLLLEKSSRLSISTYLSRTQYWKGLCTLKLFSQAPTPERRRALLFSDGAYYADRMIETILPVLYNTSYNHQLTGLYITPHSVQDFLIRSDLDGRSIESCFMRCVQIMLSAYEQPKPSDDNNIACLASLVDVFDLVLSHMGPPKIMDPTTVSEGQMYFCTKRESNKPDKFTLATVVKIHRDDYPNLYFTVRDQLQNNEYQTVPERLIAYDENTPDTEQQSNIVKWVDLVDRVENIITEGFLNNVSKHFDLGDMATFSEYFNCVIRDFPLRNVGVGSSRYIIYQCFTVLENKIINLAPREQILGDINEQVREETVVHAEDKQSSSVQKMYDNSSVLLCQQVLETFSLMSSGGVFTRWTKDSNLTKISFNPVKSINSLHRLFADPSFQNIVISETEKARKTFFLSAARYLRSVISAVEDANTLELIAELLDKMVRTSLSFCQDYTVFVIHVVEASLELQERAKEIGKKNITVRCLEAILQINVELLQFNEYSEPFLDEWINLCFRYISCGGNKTDVVNAGQKCIEVVMYLLNFTKSCIFALRTLSIIAKGSVSFEYSVINLLSLFFDDLDADDDESLLIRDELIGAMKRLPQQLIEAMNSWKNNTGEEYGDDNDDDGSDKLDPVSVSFQWLSLLIFYESSDSESRACIVTLLQKLGVLDRVLDILVSFAHLKSVDSKWLTSPVSDGSEQFTADTNSLHQLATYALFRTIYLLPAMTKKWWSEDCPRGLQVGISNFVESHVTPKIINNELTRISKPSSSELLGDMEVKGSLILKEFVASYTQDESVLSVVISLPPNYPLRNAEVDCKKTLGVPEKRWRRWSLQIMRMLNTEGSGGVLDALLLWKENVDKEFEGVEPCPVCYSVLCVKSRTMPNLMCHTCNNKFHASCLYKWFSSSGKSQCVLCQQPWSGRRV